MKDLLIAIARGLVEDPSAVTVDVDEPDEEGALCITFMWRKATWGVLSASRGGLPRPSALLCALQLPAAAKRSLLKSIDREADGLQYPSASLFFIKYGTITGKVLHRWKRIGNAI